MRQLDTKSGALSAQSTPKLEAALKQFQESFGFARPSGQPDERTLAALETFFL